MLRCLHEILCWSTVFLIGLLIGSSFLSGLVLTLAAGAVTVSMMLGFYLTDWRHAAAKEKTERLPWWTWF